MKQAAMNQLITSAQTIIHLNNFLIQLQHFLVVWQPYQALILDIIMLFLITFKAISISIIANYISTLSIPQPFQLPLSFMNNGKPKVMTTENTNKLPILSSHKAGNFLQ